MIREYDKEHCWQYDIRLNNIDSDIKASGISKKELNNINIKDFEFKAHDLSIDKSIYKEAKEFIQRHEWLGKMSLYPTYIFTAHYKGILAGVVVHDMPLAFSKLLGEKTRKMERLISRGACISWSPKGLASALIMFSIRWSVKNTRYRVFTAYSDPEAKELGTIYQACNFIYLGQKSGTIKQYKSPETGRWISDRSFRSRSAYKRYAKKLGIEWNSSWQQGDKIFWDKIPDNIEEELRDMGRKTLLEAEIRIVPRKHKYCYILGKNKGETKTLKRQFKELNPKNINLSYPKIR